MGLREGCSATARKADGKQRSMPQRATPARRTAPWRHTCCVHSRESAQSTCLSSWASPRTAGWSTVCLTDGEASADPREVQGRNDSARVARPRWPEDLTETTTSVPTEPGICAGLLAEAADRRLVASPPGHPDQTRPGDSKRTDKFIPLRRA